MDPLPRPPKQRVRRSAEEWRAILQHHEASGLSAREFCRGEGLMVSTLQRWRHRFSTDAASPSPGFVELRPTPSPVSAWSVELELPGGGTLRIRS